MHDYPEAYDAEHLQELINANDSCPDVAIDEVNRIVDLAERRAQLREEDSVYDATDTDCVIATDWTGFASGEFGYDNGEVNQFAMGVVNSDASSGKDATLFNETVVLQNGWLQTGDGRRSKVEKYEDEEFEKASVGDMWIPKGAQQYIAIIAIAPELVHGEPDLADAM